MQPNGVCHFPLLDVILLEQQSSFFVTAMQSNCSFAMLPLHDYNPTTCMWKQVANNYILRLKMFKFFRLIKLVIIMVLGNVEDERTFSTLIFMKSKLINQLTTHLDLVVKIYA
jgi:hypothetical protein